MNRITIDNRYHISYANSDVCLQHTDCKPRVRLTDLPGDDGSSSCACPWAGANCTSCGAPTPMVIRDKYRFIIESFI